MKFFLVLLIIPIQAQSQASVVNSISLYFDEEPQEKLLVSSGSIVRVNCRPGREEEVLRRPKTIVSDVQQDQPDGEHDSQSQNTKNKQITEWKHNANGCKMGCDNNKKFQK